jgi:hypothetical protein
MNNFSKTLTWISLFAVAMGFLESAVVIYLRELYYPSGFQFPLQPIPVSVARVELFRELATLIMLVGVGILAGKTKLQRFAYFVLAFGIWDLFYYLFLYLCIGWPQSLATWDILFLIPVPWVGPVWAPCLLCVIMIAGSLQVICRIEKNNSHTIHIVHWWLMIAGAFVCIVSFLWDYLAFTYHQSDTWSMFSSQQLFCDMKVYTPQEFNYLLFFAGFLFMTSSLLLSILKSNKK